MKCYSSKTNLFYSLFTQNRTLIGEINEIDKTIHSQRHDLLYATGRKGIWASIQTIALGKREMECILDWTTGTNHVRNQYVLRAND